MNPVTAAFFFKFLRSFSESYSLNPLCAKFVSQNLKKYICIFCHVLMLRGHSGLKSFLMEDKDQGIYATLSVLWLLMVWWHKEPGHRHPWYQPCFFHIQASAPTGLTCAVFLWGRVTHICVSNLTIIGSDNGLSPGWRQAIIWTNAGILFIGPFGTNQWNFNRNSNIFIQENAFESVICEMVAILSWSQCVKMSHSLICNAFQYNYYLFSFPVCDQINTKVADWEPAGPQSDSAGDRDHGLAESSTYYRCARRLVDSLIDFWPLWLIMTWVSIPWKLLNIYLP